MPAANASSSSLRLICDEQLGRLTKWLRLQGFDTLFECPISDTKLIRLAQSEGRFILTRDTHLPARTLWGAVVVLEETDYEKQLLELRKKLKLRPGVPFSRCLDCNQLIRPIPKAQVESRVPPAVFGQYDDFYTCHTCKKIFWRGTHVKNSEARLRWLTR